MCTRVCVQVTLTLGEIPESNPTIMVEFKIPQLAVSGLKVSRLDIYGEASNSNWSTLTLINAPHDFLAPAPFHCIYTDNFAVFNESNCTPLISCTEIQAFQGDQVHHESREVPGPLIASLMDGPATTHCV